MSVLKCVVIFFLTRIRGRRAQISYVCGREGGANSGKAIGYQHPQLSISTPFLIKNLKFDQENTFQVL